MQEPAEPKTFLSVASKEKVYFEPTGELKDYPTYETLYELSTKKKSYEREAYTILELLGDFGGFNDALLMLVGLVTSFYSS